MTLLTRKDTRLWHFWQTSHNNSGSDKAMPLIDKHHTVPKL